MPEMLGFAVRICCLLRTLLLLEGEGLRPPKFLRDRKAAAGNLFRIGFVEVFPERLFETLGVEPGGQNRGKADDVGAGLQLLGVLPHHFFLEGIPQGFGLGLEFFHKLFQRFQFLDFGDDGCFAHCNVAFSFDVCFP